MKNLFFLLGLALGVFQSAAIADTTVTNTSFGFSAYLPNDWIVTQVNDSHVVFNDTTNTYRSQIAIKKYLRNAEDYATATDWIRAHFIAYLFVVQYSWDPFGAVLYFDSTANSKQDSLWAPEAYSEFFTIDTTLGPWDEYIRYTATNDYGYELYAMGDTADMKANIGTYMALIRFVCLNNQSSTVNIIDRNTVRKSFAITQAALSSGYFNLQGKRCISDRTRSNGIYYRPASALLQIKVK
jgi:hypothetical protein